MIVDIDDDDFRQLVEDDPAYFDPLEYGIDVDTMELVNGDVEVTDWERVDSRGRVVPDDYEETADLGGEA